ncbi:hypothetical protein BZA77DRAFT_138825 [Pyronema omphalodes]|nr:hypothetical protein BZA77DRAFT_138825 [Pyronema omphalodes]
MIFTYLSPFHMRCYITKINQYPPLPKFPSSVWSLEKSKKMPGARCRCQVPVETSGALGTARSSNQTSVFVYSPGSNKHKHRPEFRNGHLSHIHPSTQNIPPYSAHSALGNLWRPSASVGEHINIHTPVHRWGILGTVVYLDVGCIRPSMLISIDDAAFRGYTGDVYVGTTVEGFVCLCLPLSDLAGLCQILLDVCRVCWILPHFVRRRQTLSSA